ncbi:hypothetical protein MUK42_29797 [Musa troglodytarum]|uniref:Uncharacterized protein n=1 Tax=Musa troglodytarum TaxID=320322 RepID=A0A9E7FMX6_9LILI|nr:hypothetical protein MUK42_29797 [Musa troglodytarum]
MDCHVDNALRFFCLHQVIGPANGRRPIPKRGQIKSRIATTAMNSVASALWRVIHCNRILLGNPF